MASFLDYFTGNAGIGGGLGGYGMQQPAGLGDYFGQNRNAFVGLGMGLMQPGGNPWGQALQGYQSGAQADYRNRALQQQLLQHQQDLALRREALNKEPEQIRQLRLMGVDPASSQARELLYPRTEEWKPIQTGVDRYNNPIWRMYNQRTGAFQDLPGATPTTPTTPLTQPFTAGPGVGYGQAGAGAGGFGTGYFAGPAAPAPPTTTGAATAPTIAPGVNSAFPSTTGNIPSTDEDMMAPAPPGYNPKVWQEEQTKLRIKQQQERVQAAKSAPRVTQDIERAINAVQNPEGYLPTTGIFGGAIKNVYQPAADLDKLLGGIRANVSIDALNAMRAASPTGGALGNVSDKDMAKLEAIMGNLEQSQSKDQLLYNLDRLQREVHETVHGPGTAPPPRFAPPRSQQAPGGTGTRQGGAAIPRATTRDDYAAELRRRGVRLPGE